MFQVGLPPMPEGFDWKRVIEEARQQAVLPLVAEGMASLPPARQAPQELKQ
ncbi:MAG: nucleotidyltransferase family protein, partial [Clostridiales bacterium]|nr:nucleotidyltransferase family protein [Clostridiales bacterium]